MTTIEVPVEHTTQLALAEKSKLKKSLRRFDMVFFTVCAFVGLDTLGVGRLERRRRASRGSSCSRCSSSRPTRSLMAEVGSLVHRGRRPVRVDEARLRAASHAGIGAILYWVTNPLWVGGSLAFIATEAWRDERAPVDVGQRHRAATTCSSCSFIWFSIGVAIVVAAARASGSRTPAAFARVFVTLGLLHAHASSSTGSSTASHGFSAGDLSPTTAVFLALVPVLLFNYVGFELQNGAAEEMENPQRDVPISVVPAARVIGVLLYVIPILGILLVLPLDKVTGIGGFVDAVTEMFSVYGGAAHDFLLVLTTLGFIGTPRHVGRRLDDRLRPRPGGRGLRRRVLPAGSASSTAGSGRRCASTSSRGSSRPIFCVAAIAFFKRRRRLRRSRVVLTIAISTTLISYLWIFPAASKLRYSHGDVHRPYRVPVRDAPASGSRPRSSRSGSLLGSWVAVFPGTLEPLFGVDYDFVRRGLGRLAGEVRVPTRSGRSLIVVAVGLLGYVAGAGVRKQEVIVPIEEPSPAPA